MCIHININISTFMFELQITLIECFDYSNRSDYSYTSFFVAILMNPVKGNSASQKKLLLTLQLSITKEITFVATVGLRRLHTNRP